MDAAVGQSLGRGRFEVISRIGEGGAGVVYGVKDRQSDSRLALKTVRGAGPDALVSLKREFRAVQDIAHPNLVRLDELFEEDGAWFFTMELVQGRDWLSYVRSGEGGAVDPARVKASLAQLVEALAALHAKGTVHRDVKPSNVLVSGDGHVKVLDFGIASGKYRIGDASEGVVGTLAYMAPEQLLSEEPTAAADLYAVGAMLYQALTGHIPHDDRARHSTEERALGPATPVLRLAPGAPPDLAALCDDLLRMDPRDRPDADAVLRALGAEGAVSSIEVVATKEEFVGRARETGELRDAFEATTRGETVAVVLEGASGVGKSALMDHFLGAIAGSALVLEGRCHEREFVPYKGFDAVVDGLAAYLAEGADDILFSLSDVATRLLPRLFPVLKRVPYFARLADGSLHLPEGDASELRARIFGAFRELLRRVAIRTPLVVTIDDIQWADGDTLALLGDLLAPPSPPPLLLVCTRRIVEEEPGAQATPLTLPGDVRTIRLSGLSEDELASLAARLAPSTPLAAAEIHTLAKESGGHPLFLQELMRRRARGTEESPRLRLDDALWDRVALLEPEDRSLVEATAMAGIPTPLLLVAGAAALPRGTLPQALARLRGANLVKVSADSAGGRVIEPYHDRVREAVTRHLDPASRRNWHERLAKALGGAAERDVEQLALHWEGAGDAARAADLYQEAGDRACQAFAFDHAVDLYRRALSLGGERERPGLRYALADALFNAGRGAEAGQTFLALAAREKDAAATELLMRAAKSFLGSGHFSEGVEALRVAIATAGLQIPEGRFRVVFLILWHRLMLRLSGFALARRDPATVTEAERRRFDLCSAAAFGLGMADTVRGAVFQHQGARLALKLGDPRRAARGLCGLALSMCTGGLKTAKVTARVIDQARSLAAGLDDPYLDGLVAGASGFATFMIEDFIAAERWLSEADRRFRDLQGVSFERASARLMHGRALFHLGRLKDMRVYVGPPMRDALRKNDVYAIVNTRATVATYLALARGDVDEAESEIEESLRVIASHRFQMQHVYCLYALCTLDLYRGRPESVLSRLKAAAPDLRATLFERVQSIRILLASLRARAHLALAAASLESRRAHLARAEREARRLGSEGLPGAAGQSQLVLAGRAHVRGDAAGAVAHLRAAIARFDGQGMKLHAGASREALGRLVGGDEGAELTRLAAAPYAEEEIAEPLAFMQQYAPGLPW